MIKITREKFLRIILWFEFLILVGLIIYFLVNNFEINKIDVGLDNNGRYVFFIKNVRKFNNTDECLKKNEKRLEKDKKNVKKKERLKKYTYNQLKKFVKNILFYHGVKPIYTRQTYDKICNLNIKLCNKVKFYNSSFDKQVEYLAIIQFVIRSIDNNLDYDRKIEDVLKSITVDFFNTRRGYAGHGIVLVNAGLIKSNKEFLNVLTHELGHVLDLSVLKGKSLEKDKKYTEFGNSVFSIDDPSIDFYKISWISEKVRRGGQTYKDFVSGYGMTDPFEDFAECFNVYMNHYLYFKYLALNNYVLGQKFEFFQNLFGGFHFFDDIDSLKKVKISPTWRVRDSTLMK